MCRSFAFGPIYINYRLIKLNLIINYFTNIYNSLAHYTRGTLYYNCSLLFYLLLFPYGTFSLILIYCLSSWYYFILTSWQYFKTTILSLTVTYIAPVGYFQVTQMFHSTWFLFIHFHDMIGYYTFLSLLSINFRSLK